MFGIFGNIDVDPSCSRLLLKTDGDWMELALVPQRFESIGTLLAALNSALSVCGVRAGFVFDPAGDCGMFVRIARAGALALDFRVSGLGALLGYPSALLDGSETYYAPASPQAVVLCEAPAYDSGWRIRENAAALRCNSGRMHVQRMSCIAGRTVRLAALSRKRTAALSGIMRRTGSDPDSGFYCCKGLIAENGGAPLDGERKMFPAGDCALSFTRSFRNCGVDLWDCEICAVAKENP